ncbi:MarR family winged helix-turn-helix transcriptional regulator [Gandjariella thermophila]|uniref:MarR family transcriptional regulator n=1 Tax=Gandjariella thermophila TaxID=1931992 RepID=A0A4D4JBF9_9PSEU|nr:MarR family transcriptional regulator [Gandjariella thermophila]GDY31183.1 MarR family transcriptional regulator [Gandjariella thermophila]
MATVLADELMAAVAGLRRLIRRRLRDRWPGERLRGAEVELLRVVEDQPGIGVAAAARELHLAGNSVSTLVNRLVDAGLLSRETDPSDRRAARLRLTPAAAHRLTAWRQARSELVGRALAGLDAADVEAIEQALPALRRLAERLAGSGESP